MILITEAVVTMSLFHKQIDRNRIKLKRQAEKTVKEADKLRRRQQHLLAQQGEASVAFLFIFAHYFPPFNL